MQALDPEAQAWVERTLGALSLEEQLAQMMLPVATGEERMRTLLSFLERFPLGGAFFWSAPPEILRGAIQRLQEASRIPLIVAADLENGPGGVVAGSPTFPDLLALAAADDEQAAYTMATAAARCGRHVGIHWSFAPLVDVNLNPDNPIVNTRGLGDDPERVVRLSRALIRGFQDHGMAACAKHFPGDGADDRDQHTTTSVNPLPLERWKQVYGRTFGAAYEAGVWTTMIGHIAWPAWDPTRNRFGVPRPATLSGPLVTELLRREMGFRGLAVTDDINMAGAAGYLKRPELLEACVAAGCDMVLFPSLPEDFEILRAAVVSGRIPESRVREAARRVLELKARVRLHRAELYGPPPSDAERREWEAAAREIAVRAVTCVRDEARVLPVRLPPGASVLTVTLSADGVELPVVDEELRRRGFRVDHRFNPDDAQFYLTARNYAAVFVNFTQKAHWCVGSVRCVGPHNRMWMRAFYREHPCAVFTSFGSPYHLRTFANLPNLINVYSACPDSQRAAVAGWFGEISMAARSPVAHLVRE